MYCYYAIIGLIYTATKPKGNWILYLSCGHHSRITAYKSFVECTKNLKWSVFQDDSNGIKIFEIPVFYLLLRGCKANLVKFGTENHEENVTNPKNSNFRLRAYISIDLVIVDDIDLNRLYTSPVITITRSFEI